MRKPIITHGLFVMKIKNQIAEAFADIGPGIFGPYLLDNRVKYVFRIENYE